jgi:hypothetical protein
MSLVPSFELGVWNAWIFMVPLIVLSAILTKMVVKRESIEDSNSTKKEKMIFTIHHLIFLASCVYSKLLPLKLDFFWFNVGLLFYLLGYLLRSWHW